MADNDYYKTLGVKRDASADDIKKAYKKLVRKYHPDVKPDDKEAAQKFKEIQEANSVLSDPEKRSQYDRFGKTFTGGGAGPGGAGAWSSGPVDLNDILGGGFDLGDLFGGSFGGGAGARGRAQPRPTKGEDIRLDGDISFHVAALGGNHSIQLRRDNQTERLNVKIPAGVESGKSIRLSGQGHPGHNGGPAGDLLLTVRVAQHPYFRREGTNLIIDVPITIPEAALGAKVEVPTLDEGPVTVTIPPGTSSGSKLRLKEKGILNPKTNERGNILVVIKIVAPKELSDRETELYQELSQLDKLAPRSALWKS